MSEHLIVGKQGEDLAANWLKNKDYIIIDRNWRSGRYEVDIIATKMDCLHFVEVKTRSSFQVAMPEQKVNGGKMKHLKIAAMKYLELHPQWKMIQFDVLSIVLGNNKAFYYFIEDVF
ncbi:YraN family protein [Polluticaenibacter yanchengensis]|uniref:UPF0102 protein O3P16_10140 n=1 Tax=Polluticaenibacter yanchengensis TaxID=3014562 RepID=A0ABT4UK02_9BACT|nr:YraN family protein [Chitinophagaceae bacterium LY-5]